MTGIPMPVKRDGAWSYVHLSTQRTGELGEKLQLLRAEFRLARREWIKATKRIALAGVALAALSDPDYERTVKISEQQDEAAAGQEHWKDRMLSSATRIAELALTINYGPTEAAAILDTLTDPQIARIPDILEAGETPADFFRLPAPLPKDSGTGPGIDSTAESSSNAASPASRSIEGK